MPYGAMCAVALALSIHLAGQFSFRQPVANGTLRRKMSDLTQQARPVLAFAGDSRMRSGAVPAVITKSLNLQPGQVVNFAEVSCDSAAMWAAYHEFSARFSAQPILVLGVSALTINDGYLQVGDELLWDLSFRERCRLVPTSRALMAGFLPEKALWNILTSSYWPRDASIAQGGYSLEYGGRDLTRFREKDWRKAARMVEDQWFNRPCLDGLRWTKLATNIDRFIGSGVQLVLVDLPYHPGFGRYTQSAIQQLDQDFHQRLVALAAGRRIPLLVFPEGWQGEANPDALFYDLVHLNRAGAKVFSRQLASRIGDLAEQGLVRIDGKGPLLARRTQ